MDHSESMIDDDVLLIMIDVIMNHGSYHGSGSIMDHFTND